MCRIFFLPFGENSILDDNAWKELGTWRWLPYIYQRIQNISDAF